METPKVANSVARILEAGWHARMSSRSAGKGACACGLPQVSNIRLWPSPRVDIGATIQSNRRIASASTEATVHLLRGKWGKISKASGLLIGLCLQSHAAWGSEPPSSSLIDGLPSCSANFGKLLEQRTVNFTPLDVMRDAEVGGTILGTEKIGVYDAGIVLKSEVIATGKHFGAGFVITLPPGSYEPIVGYSAFLSARQAPFKYDREGKERSGFGRPDITLSADGPTLMVNVSYGLGSTTIAIPHAQFDLQRCVTSGPRSLRREVLYSGGSKGTIMLEYREFVDDLARPAFSQTVSFDLASGKEIGFRGARIRVESISNLGMRYTLLRSLE